MLLSSGSKLNPSKNASFTECLKSSAQRLIIIKLNLISKLKKTLFLITLSKNAMSFSIIFGSQISNA